jgi:hypothetical protein
MPGLASLTLCEPAAVLGVGSLVSCEPVLVLVLVFGLVLVDESAAFDEFAPPPPQADSAREPAPKTSVERNLRRIALGISERVEAMKNSLE